MDKRAGVVVALWRGLAATALSAISAKRLWGRIAGVFGKGSK